jgi:hypothetical protein
VGSLAYPEHLAQFNLSHDLECHNVRLGFVRKVK